MATKTLTLHIRDPVHIGPGEEARRASLWFAEVEYYKDTVVAQASETMTSRGTAVDEDMLTFEDDFDLETPSGEFRGFADSLLHLGVTDDRDKLNQPAQKQELFEFSWTQLIENYATSRGLDEELIALYKLLGLHAEGDDNNDEELQEFAHNAPARTIGSSATPPYILWDPPANEVENPHPNPTRAGAAI
ncbi:hypothetical protein L227DRAFT_614828 [Lentinus tigrinus ALCF2SS1-6]|uniref:Uncharacterized protein n=1 Tax=Lentinus tigrinus ALCF2SS1-6 TaxID=1328759 RepID=A0A5C2RXZ8_9APHY|nr:hypothetical protein L227DRAFT_614828 [Lentinus tigrinus ALCF2SS1-6]